MIISWLRHRKSIRQAAGGLYQAAVAQSRDPRFYSDLDVADTMDGRFDLITMHVFLILERLRQTGSKGQYMSQCLFDHMFMNVELTLREIGVGDMAVPKHMKKMMKAFNGRIHTYHNALRVNDVTLLELAVVKNIYRADDGHVPTAAHMMAEYISLAAGSLLRQDLDSFLAGRVCFPDIPTLKQAYA